MNKMRPGFIRAFNTVFAAAVIPFTLAACSDKKDDITNPPKNNIPSVNITVLSDVHYFDPDLGTTGDAFEQYVGRDRKLLAESESILKSAITAVKSENSELVLITGDLTKDGEITSHQKAAAFFAQMEAAGKKVFVIPGNHDVNNYGAMSYSGSAVTRVDNVTAEDFARIYKDFGYNEALERDPNSLSYVAEPVKGLRILAIDACRYKDGVPGSRTGGIITPETMKWIKEKLKAAETDGAFVIGMMHHALVEHFTGQKQLLYDFVVDNWQQTAQELADNGLEIIFTGHMHVQDVVSFTSSSGNVIYDIETGSLVTYPNPYRAVQLNSDGTLTLKGKTITSIDYDTKGKAFPDYAKGYLETGIRNTAAEVLVSGFNVKQEELPALLPVISSALVAHTKGDEKPDPETALAIQRLLSSGDSQKERLALLLGVIYNDPAPPDNDIVIRTSFSKVRKEL